MTELNVIGIARGDIISVEHECANAIVELGRNVIVLVGHHSVQGLERIGVVSGRVGDLIIGLGAERRIAVAGFDLLKQSAGRKESDEGEKEC